MLSSYIQCPFQGHSTYGGAFSLHWLKLRPPQIQRSLFNFQAIANSSSTHSTGPQTLIKTDVWVFVQYTVGQNRI